jgi:hemolysin III
MVSTKIEVNPDPPKLRGWFHLGAAPVVFVASVVLFILSKDSLKFAVALYSFTAITLFTVSAIYHRVNWSPKNKKIWRRWDHANINLLIAGSVTPFAVTLLSGRDRTVLLLEWACASSGSMLHVGSTLLIIYFLGGPPLFLLPRCITLADYGFSFQFS